MNDYIEMEVAIVEGLEDEVAYFWSRNKILADFLVANFGDEIGLGNGAQGENAVQAAVRLLGELKERRKQGKALTAELVTAMRLIDLLEADAVDASTQIDYGRRRT